MSIFWLSWGLYLFHDFLETYISCYTLQHTVTHCTTLQHTAPHCTTLQHTATHCNTIMPLFKGLCLLFDLLGACNFLSWLSWGFLRHTTTHCTQFLATHYNTLQHTASHCTTLHCNDAFVSRDSTLPCFSFRRPYWFLCEATFWSILRPYYAPLSTGDSRNQITRDSPLCLCMRPCLAPLLSIFRSVINPYFAPVWNPIWLLYAALFAALCGTMWLLCKPYPTAPVNHAKKMKGWCPRDAPWELASNWYRTFPEHFGRVEMKKPIGLSNDTSTA